MDACRITSQVLVVFVLSVCGLHGGNLDQFIYLNVPGDRVSDLREGANVNVFPENPNPIWPYVELMDILAHDSTQITYLETKAEAIFGQVILARWIRGFLEPPETGSYEFYVSGSDDAEFWLSPNANYTNKVLEAWTDGPTGLYEWDVRSTQRSRSILLEGGKQYYFELIQKNAEATQAHAAIGWKLPDGTFERPIPLHRTQRFAFEAWTSGWGTGAWVGSFVKELEIPTPIIYRNPGEFVWLGDSTNRVVMGETLDLSPGINANYPVTFQWFESDDGVNFQPIPDRITSSFFIPEVTEALDGKTYFLRITHGDADDFIDSSKLTLEVVPVPLELSITRTEAGIELSWPLEDGGFELESTTLLPPNASDWQVVPGATDVRTNPRLIVPSPGELQRFWRLKKE